MILVYFVLASVVDGEHNFVYRLAVLSKLAFRLEEDRWTTSFWLVDVILEVSRHIYPACRQICCRGKTFYSLVWQTLKFVSRHETHDAGLYSCKMNTSHFSEISSIICDLF